jgi:hypothetical protein
LGPFSSNALKNPWLESHQSAKLRTIDSLSEETFEKHIVAYLILVQFLQDYLGMPSMKKVKKNLGPA